MEAKRNGGPWTRICFTPGVPAAEGVDAIPAKAWPEAPPETESLYDFERRIVSRPVVCPLQGVVVQGDTARITRDIWTVAKAAETSVLNMMNEGAGVGEVNEIWRSAVLHGVEKRPGILGIVNGFRAVQEQRSQMNGIGPRQELLHPAVRITRLEQLGGAMVRAFERQRRERTRVLADPRYPTAAW